MANGTYGTWLYNGVELPSFGLWDGSDHSTYPYAIVYVTGDGEEKSYTPMMYGAQTLRYDPVEKKLTTIEDVIYYSCRFNAEASLGVSYTSDGTFSKTSYYSDITDILWSSCDILTPDGEVYIKGNLPVSTAYNLRLYGDVELQKLPVLEGYPYIAMRSREDYSAYTDGRCFDAMYSKTGFYFRASDGALVDKEGAINPRYVVDWLEDQAVIGEEWSRSDGYPTSSSWTINEKRPFIWANHDILNEDGTLAYKGSLAVDPNAPVEPDTPVTPGCSVNGNGMALYNGVMLPNIDNVWTDKETYPYAYLTRMDADADGEAMHGYYLYLSDTKAYHSSLTPGLLMIPATSKVVTYWLQDGASEYTLMASEDSTQVFTPITYPDEIVAPVVWSCAWCSVDICGDQDTSTVYFAASDPISLDGMHVIEWDGDTNSATNLSGTGMDGLYMVSDTYIDFADGDKYICVIWNGDEYVTYPQHTELNLNIDSLDGEKAWSLGIPGANIACGFNVPSQSLVGTAFMYAGDADYNIRTTLLAYQATASSGHATPQNDWMKGYIIGKALAKAMPYRAVEKDVLDNSWPIQFNTLAVANNSTKFVAGETEIVKISNLTLDEEEAMGLTATVTVDGVATPLIGLGATHFDIGSIVMFGANVSDGEFGIVSATSTRASADLYGFAFPDTGLYAILPVQDGELADVNVTLRQGVAPKYFFDSFPIDINIAPAYLGHMLNQGNEVPLIQEDGTQNGTYLKISNMTPSLEDLVSMNLVAFGIVYVDGVGELSDKPVALNPTWDESGQFVKLDGNSAIVVYEEKTINTTVSGEETPATVNLTPGIWLTDGFLFIALLSAIFLTQGSVNDTWADDGIRFFYGSAEDAEKVLEEYNTTE